MVKLFFSAVDLLSPREIRAMFLHYFGQTNIYTENEKKMFENSSVTCVPLKKRLKKIVSE